MVFWKKLTTNEQQTHDVRAISAAKTDVDADADAAAELSNQTIWICNWTLDYIWIWFYIAHLLDIVMVMVASTSLP